ncbi:hypothetical protein GW931_03410 [archaeon]|nr:hypothetical protein [archaeon]PJC45245.1 MAG: hypothetical protein CO037_02500 [Candidatus Pacearchaeota archaeon CG_4_9_14_0_2_um_filter_30_8]
MVKKKRVTKKTSKKKPVVRKKAPVRRAKEAKIMVSERKIKRATNSLIYSGIVFVISLVLFLFTTDFLESLFGFILIISGAFIILFVTLEIIFYFMRKK